MVQTDRAKGRHDLFRGIRIVKTSRLIFDCLKRIQVSYVSTEELVCTMGKRKWFASSRTKLFELWVWSLPSLFRTIKKICFFLETFPGRRWCHHEYISRGFESRVSRSILPPRMNWRIPHFHRWKKATYLLNTDPQFTFPTFRPISYENYLSDETWRGLT